MELIKKDQQFYGFRQVWTVRPDGVFHGVYTVYWESGATICMRGEYINGNQEGVWTYWDRQGKLKARRHPINGYRLYERAALRRLIDAIRGDEE